MCRLKSDEQQNINERETAQVPRFLERIAYGTIRSQVDPLKESTAGSRYK
jgi:hypothetical protein